MTKRYFYLNKEGKIIRHYEAKQEIDPEGFEFVGMSQLPVRTAAASYVRNQPGHKLQNGDEIQPPEPKDPEPIVEPVEQPTQEAAE